MRVTRDRDPPMPFGGDRSAGSGVQLRENTLNECAQYSIQLELAVGHMLSCASGEQICVGSRHTWNLSKMDGLKRKLGRTRDGAWRKWQALDIKQKPIVK